MEAADKELILRLLPHDPLLRRLYVEHQELENRLNEYNTRSFLTADEQMEEKRLKKRKLFGVDKMMELVATHREQAAVL